MLSLKAMCSANGAACPLLIPLFLTATVIKASSIFLSFVFGLIGLIKDFTGQIRPVFMNRFAAASYMIPRGHSDTSVGNPTSQVNPFSQKANFPCN